MAGTINKCPLMYGNLLPSGGVRKGRFGFIYIITKLQVYLDFSWNHKPTTQLRFITFTLPVSNPRMSLYSNNSKSL